MIPTKSDIVIEDNLPGEKIVMGLAQEGLAHIMDVLTNLYKDMRMAIVREYSTNAWDAHVAAGCTRPIEVSLPNDLSPFLKIRDYGVGLDRNDIMDVYSKYGASTKRDNNEEQGNLGLGSKSALAYTEQFSIVGIKSEMRSMVSVSRSEDEGATMTIMETSETVEEDGVEIIIPVMQRDYRAINEKAADLFAYWEPGRVMVNGKAPEHIKGVKITDSIMLVPKGTYDETNVVVMGGVPYEIPEEVNPFVAPSHDHKLVAFVDIGEVSFTPSRESLRLTTLTRNRMALVKKEFEKALKVVVQKEIDAAKSPNESIPVMEKWKEVLPSDHPAVECLTYRGKDLPNSVEFPTIQIEMVMTNAETNKEEVQRDSTGKVMMENYLREFITAPNRSMKVGEHYKRRRLNLSSLLESLQVTGFDLQEFTPAHKRKLEKYVEDKQMKVTYFVLTRFYGGKADGPLNTTWTKPEMIVPWADIKDIKVPRKENTVIATQWRKKGSYDIYIDGYLQYEVEAEHISTGRPLYYVLVNRFTNGYHPNSRYYQDRTRDAVECLGKGQVVKLGANREAKFLRDFPNAKELSSELEARYNKLAKQVTDRAKKAIALSRHASGRTLKALDAERVRDPELSKMIKLVKTSSKPYAEAQKYERIYAYFRKPDVSIRTIPANTTDLSAYPLLQYIPDTRINSDHTYIYLNAAYKAARKEK